MTTLVTGGAGFIGSHVARHLLAHHERVVIVDNFNDYYDPALKYANAEALGQHPNAKVIEGDIRQADHMLQLFKAYGVRRVIHLAALAGVRASLAQAPLYWEVNTTGTLHLLEAAQAVGCELFILGSTSSVYGRTEQLPFTEDDPADRPLAAYPASKRAAEILAHSYFHVHGLPITILRFFNVYGPAGRPDMMPLRLMRAITQQAPITIFNEGNIERDWTYVDDTVAGIVAAWQQPRDYAVFNLGLGAPVSLNAFISIIEDLAGQIAIREDVPTPPSEPPITYCNNQRAREALGFAPQVTLETGLARTWDWFQRTSLNAR